MGAGVLVAALLLAAVFSNAAGATVVEEFKAEDWDGMAFTSDETGEFTHCSIFASYRNGSTLFISFETSESWYLSVSNDSWSLTEAENYDIKFKIDRRGEIEGTGYAIASHQVGLPVEADHPFIGQLRRGNQLTITFQNEDYAFELSNSNKAMKAAQDCVSRHVAAGTRTNVTNDEPTEPAADTETESSAEPVSEPAADPLPEEDAAAAPEPDNPAPAPPDSAAQASGEEQTFGPWVVASTRGESGAFANCTAYGMHGDDQLILSYFPDGIWTFGLYRAAWNLDANQTYYLWYNVDASADAEGVIKRPVEAAEPTRIFFQVSDLEDIIERIEAGTTLNLQFRSLTGAPENFSYPLDRANEAFAATRQCVSDHAIPGGVSKEGGGTKGGGAEVSASTDEGSDETTRSGESSGPHTVLPALGTTLVEEFDVPGWKAAAFSLDDATFTHCAIKADYQNGATFGIARAAGGDYVLAVQHGDWALAPNSSVPISYTVTGATPLSSARQGQVAEANLILAIMGGEELTETLKSATTMTIDTEGKNLSFDVSDIGPGIAAIDECVARNSETAVAAAPDAPSRAEEQVASADAEAAPIDIRTEAAGFTTALLFRSGYPNHVILQADASAPDLPVGDVLWQLGDVTGSTRIVTSGTPGDIERDAVDDLTDQCGGAPATWPVASDATHSQFTMVCAGESRTIQFVVVPREGGGSYVFAMNGRGDDIAEELTATALYSRALGG